MSPFSIETSRMGNPSRLSPSGLHSCARKGPAIAISKQSTRLARNSHSNFGNSAKKRNKTSNHNSNFQPLFDIRDSLTTNRVSLPSLTTDQGIPIKQCLARLLPRRHQFLLKSSRPQTLFLLSFQARSSRVIQPRSGKSARSRFAKNNSFIVYSDIYPIRGNIPCLPEFKQGKREWCRAVYW